MTAGRRWLLGGVGAAAALAGLGGALWRAPQRVEEAIPGLWALRFPTPDGGTLALADHRGQRLLINFWATWCPPCVRELPLLDRFHREQQPQGWQVIGLAIDSLAPVQAFLQRQPLGFPIGLAGLDGSTLARQLGNANGGLPFSVALDAQGVLRERHLGELQAPDLARWVEALA